MALDIASFVIEKLANPALQEVSLLYSVAGKVASVKRRLEWMKVFLEAAEKKEKEDKAVKLWVDQVREVSFRIEDAIDVYLLEVKGDHTPAQEGCHSFSFIRWFYKILQKPVALHNLGVELNDIEATLKEIDDNRERFGIKHFGVNDPSTSSCQKENPFLRRRYEFIDKEIVGLENDKKEIVKKLLDPQAHQNLHVISIVGPGGLGKTTLAQKVFHSSEVKENFEKRVWISVSQKFDKISILKKMLESFRPVKQEEKDQDMHYFLSELRACYQKKKVLIVLDDVWDEQLWPTIMTACPDDIDHGGVLITTRNENVAKEAQSEIHKPKFLNLEDSKALLYKVAFPKDEPPVGLDLAATKIAKKCRGLPLAIVVVGGRLYMEKKNNEWRKVAESIDWGSNQECMQILASSYEDMSSALKACFTYLASFPEDYKIDAKSLVRTWVAEGLASDEETAENYLQELAQRCLVIVTETEYDGSIGKFWVHDLLQDLAIKEAEEKKFLSVFAKEMPNQNSLSNTRRASLLLGSSTLEEMNSNNSDEERKVKRKYNKTLRSIAVFGKPDHGRSTYIDVAKVLPNDLMPARFRLLKVLKVHNCSISGSTLEKWCEELINLRHLELRDCVVENGEIPKSIDHLGNLLTLDCSYTNIDKLPESLWSIKTLRHVVMLHSVDSHSAEVPLPASADVLATASTLRTLGAVKLQSAPSSSPHPGPDQERSYKYFCNLRKLENGCANDRWMATLLKEPKQLVSLSLASEDLCLPLGAGLDMRVFPWYKSLRHLHLRTDYWRQHVQLQAHLFPPNLISLNLFCEFNNDPMPELGQLECLEKLHIDTPSRSKLRSMAFSAGGFPQLVKLELHDYQVEEFHIARGAMPMLKILLLYGLSMKNIPELQHLKMLQEFYWLTGYYTSYEEIQAMKEKDHAKLQHIPSVIIEPSPPAVLFRVGLGEDPY